MKYITLNTGAKMPLLGFGVYQIPQEQTEQCVADAIAVGYRLIDTAQVYRNEAQVGAAIKRSGIHRSEFFLVSKIWIYNFGYEAAKASIERSLARLKTEYLDLMLIHQPFGDYYGAYRALEEAYHEGKIRAIGIYNFHPDRFVDLANFVTVPPAVNQMETHVFQQQTQLRKIMTKNKTVNMSWGPFAEGKNDFFNNKVLKAIGTKHNKIVAQVALRFLIQNDIPVIPKSVHQERMAENFAVFDFELSPDEMAQIATLDENTSLFFSHTDPEMVDWLLQIVNTQIKNNEAI